jgi:O-antigen/teichoic acid export membrane protein
MSSDSKKFIKGITSGYAFMAFNLIVSLWLVPFSLKHLSRPEYGIFAICSDLLGWLGLTSLGVAAAFNIKSGQLLGSNDKVELNLVTSTAFFSQMISSIILVIVGIVLFYNPQFLFGTNVNFNHIEWIILILIGGYMISFILQPLNALLVASKQIHVDNYLRFGLLAIKTLLTVVLLSSGFKLFSLALSSLVATIIISIVTWIRVKKTLSFIHISWQNFKISRLKFLIGNGIWFSIGGLAGLFIFRMDSFMIGKYISLETVASFVITAKLYTIADTIHQQFFNTTRPYFSQLFGKKEMPTLKKLYDVAFNLSFGFAFFMGSIIYLINEWFIGKWVGNQFFLGHELNLLFCINFILQASVLPNRILLATTFYKNREHAISRLCEGLFKFGLCLWLVPLLGLHIVVIIGIIGSLIFSNTFLNVLSGQIVQDNFWDKMSPFLFFIPLGTTFFVSNHILKVSIIFITLTILIYFSVRKLKKEKIFLQPFYQLFYGKFFKKNIPTAKA